MLMIFSYNPYVLWARLVSQWEYSIGGRRLKSVFVQIKPILFTCGNTFFRLCVILRMVEFAQTVFRSNGWSCSVKTKPNFTKASKWRPSQCLYLSEYLEQNVVYVTRLPVSHFDTIKIEIVISDWTITIIA